MARTGLLTAASHLKLHDDALPSLPVVSSTAAAPPADPFADLRVAPLSVASAQQDAQIPTGPPASRTPTLEPETAENDLGGFDATFFSNEDFPIVSAHLNSTTHLDSSTNLFLPSTAEATPPQPSSEPSSDEPPRIPAACSLGSRQDYAPPATVLTTAQQDLQDSTSLSASGLLLPELEEAENDLGGFDASFYFTEDLLTEPTLPDIGAETIVGTETEVSPPQPQIQDPTQESEESPLVPSASEHAASTPEMATERMLAEAMPRYDPACKL